MNTTIEQLQVWMDAKEDEHLEFKEAKNHSDFEELVKYCVALANEGGGQMILGVTDKVLCLGWGRGARWLPKGASAGKGEK